MILRISFSSVNIMHFKSERVDKCNVSASDQNFVFAFSQLRTKNRRKIVDHEKCETNIQHVS